MDAVFGQIDRRTARAVGALEIQATGEKRGFSRAEFDRLFELAELGCGELFALQRAAVG